VSTMVCESLIQHLSIAKYILLEKWLELLLRAYFCPFVLYEVEYKCLEP
jgi:hypothetical protein